MKCPHCNRQIDNDSSFCTYCGKEVSLLARLKKLGSKKLIIGASAALLLIVGCFLLFAYSKVNNVEITFDTSAMEENEYLENPILRPYATEITGTIKGSKSCLKNVRFSVIDAANNEVSEGNVEIVDGYWKATDIGLMQGLNTVTITSKYLFFSKKEELSFYNINSAFLEKTNVSMDDTDGDGLIDYFENIIGTNIKKKDTDRDGLTDFEEYIYTATDPLKYSTLDDKVCDADRDPDSDGLTNKQEIKEGTEPNISDTDADGLNDFDEVNTYKTNAVLADTDEDGATDGWEILNGYDPLTYNESFTSTTVCKGENITASVTLSSKGNPESVIIQEYDCPGLIDSSMNGYLGSCFSFTSAEDFSDAEITMEFDKTCLSTGAEPCIYYFDETSQTLIELETVIDGNKASAKVEHFSKYILLDKRSVTSVIEEDIVLPEEIDKTPVNVAVVIDYSSSMDENDPSYKRLAIAQAYIKSMRSGIDQAAVIKFIDTASTIAPLTGDLEACANAISTIKNDSGGCGSGGTNGSAGLRNALDELISNNATSYKHIIFLTDGADTTQSYNYDDLIAEAVANDIKIYTIALIGSGDTNQELLMKIAEGTGGRFHVASEVDENYEGAIALDEVFSDIGIETINYIADSNQDGITDYYTRLICDGKIRTGVGSNPFGDYTYEEIQASSDVDGDGLLNGEEIELVEEDDFLRLFYYSSPIEKDSDFDGYWDQEDTHALVWDVGDRDLAIFAALAYEDGSNYMGTMYKAEDIVGHTGSGGDVGELYYFGYPTPFAGIGENAIDYGISKRWRIVDYTSVLTTGLDYFTATTYLCDNNVVIAYRGTGDMNESEATEWIDNIFNYGLSGKHAEESSAQSYARKTASKFKGYNIYLTGHSLGGYLTQIGAAELLLKTDCTPKKVSYFNGIGMNYCGLVDIPRIFLDPKGEAVHLVNLYLHLDEMNALSDYSKSHELISYRIHGDIVSSLGYHCGKEIAFEAHRKTWERDDRVGLNSPYDLYSILTLANVITAKMWGNEDFISYAKKYGLTDISAYMWVTHETDSFYYYLTQGHRSSQDE